MRPFTALSIVFALTSASPSSARGADPDVREEIEERNETHSWNAIAYPSLPCPWATRTTVPSLFVAGEGKSRELRFRLEFAWSALVPDSLVEPDPKQIKVRLHYADGTVVEPVGPEAAGDDGFTGWIGGLRGGTGSVTRVLPWGKNDFREAWIELRMPSGVYWLGVPYGFTRNPADLLCPSEIAGEPKFAPAMRELEKDAKIVNWQYAEYKLEPPQKGWSLTLRQSNPFDAACELILYKGDFRGWNLFSPRTAVLIQQPGLDPLIGDCWNIRKHDDMLRRSDYFKFNRNGGSGESRCWGKVVVKVGDAEAKVLVPSSLFNYVHGVADPYHKATYP